MNLFGTDGIRTKVGQYPISINNLIDLGKSISLWTKTKIQKPKILIAHDTRLSCSIIKSYLKAGLLNYDITLYDAQVLPTPCAYALVQKQKLFDFAIVITASHNLYHDNGIKIIDSNKDKLDEFDEQEITNYFLNKNLPFINYENVGTSYYFDNAEKEYIAYLSKFFKPNFAQNLTVVIDCANGALSKIASNVFKLFDANIICINDEPNGKNINQNCGSTKPENLQNIVLDKKADIGFAFDGDGDRIIAVNKNGSIKDGDEILAFLMSHPKYNTESLVGTLVTNYGLEQYLKKNNKKLLRTNVGDKFVAQTLIKENLLIGGEQSGHIILRDYLNSSDGLFTALRVLETMILTKNLDLEAFEKFPQSTVNLKIDTKKDLTMEPFAQIINNFQNQLNGRLVIRYSGTEPLLRITVENDTAISAKNIADQLAKELDLAFKQSIRNDINENQFTQNI